MPTGKWIEGCLTNLVLDQELDTLDGGSSSLGDSGGDTTHCMIGQYQSLGESVLMVISLADNCIEMAHTQEVDNESLKIFC